MNQHQFDPKLNNYINKSDWVSVRACFANGFQPEAYKHLQITPLRAALTNPTTPIDIIEKLLHPCLLKCEEKVHQLKLYPVHKAAETGRKDVIQLLRNANVDMYDTHLAEALYGCGLPAMQYIKNHHNNIDQEVFATLIPNTPSKLTFLFLDVICFFLKLRSFNVEKVRWIISQFIMKLPTSTVWSSFWLQDNSRDSDYKVMKIQPIGVPRGFLETTDDMLYEEVKLLLDILLLCGFTARAVHTQNYNRERLEKFKRESQQQYRNSTQELGLLNASIDSIRRSLCLPVTKDDLSNLGLPTLLWQKVNREDIVDEIMRKLQQ